MLKYKLNFKSYLQDDPRFSLTLTSILLGTNNKTKFICPLKFSL